MGEDQELLFFPRYSFKNTQDRSPFHMSKT